MEVFERYCGKYDSWYDRHKFAYLSELELLRRILPRSGKGIEVGVGTGRFAQELGITLGIDPSVEMARIAAARGVNTRWGTGEDIPFLHETFDYLAIIISLCFVRDPLKVLTEAKRVLKNRGRIFAGIVDRESFLGKHYQRKKSLFYGQARFFSAKEVIELFTITGFRSISCYQTLFNLPGKIRSVQKPEEGFGRGGFVVISGEKSRNSRH